MVGAEANIVGLSGTTTVPPKPNCRAVGGGQRGGATVVANGGGACANDCATRCTTFWAMAYLVVVSAIGAAAQAPTFALMGVRIKFMIGPANV